MDGCGSAAKGLGDVFFCSPSACVFCLSNRSSQNWLMEGKPNRKNPATCTVCPRSASRGGRGGVCGRMAFSPNTVPQTMDLF